MKPVGVRQVEPGFRLEIGKLFVSIDTRGGSLLPLFGWHIRTAAGDSSLFARVDRPRILAAYVTKAVRFEIQNYLQVGPFARSVFDRVQLPVANFFQARVF